MTVRRATVWFGEKKVGELREGERGRLLLTYDPEWARSGFPVSVSLPITRHDREQDAHGFFAGLLPEGLIRQRVCRQLRLDEQDDIGLLLAIGRDCAGALSILRDGAEVEGVESSKPISEQDFDRMVESHGQALPAPSERLRFSLAGTQDKAAVYIEGESIWLPNRDRPSTHILKFETIKRVCFAEYAAHDMARRIGLPVPPTSYHQHGEPPATPYLRVERYDRTRDADGRVRRLHQEDIAQALGYSMKYEDDGGPSLAQVAELLRSVTESPIEDIGRLRDWQLFNYLIGNADAHAKNVALVYPRIGSVPRLAPMYDLIAIEFLNRLGMHFNRNLAFFIGAHNVPEQITRNDWQAFAKSIGVPARSLLARLQELARALPDVARDTRIAFAGEFGDNPSYDKLEESIRDRCGWVLRSVGGRG